MDPVLLLLALSGALRHGKVHPNPTQSAGMQIFLQKKTHDFLQFPNENVSARSSPAVSSLGSVATGQSPPHSLPQSAGMNIFLQKKDFLQFPNENVLARSIPAFSSLRSVATGQSPAKKKQQDFQDFSNENVSARPRDGVDTSSETQLHSQTIVLP